MTTAALMQPSYIGWTGYFAMLDKADIFILDDTSAVNLKSWQMRNRIRARDSNTIWLSVPTNAKRGMPLNEVKVIENGWRKKHWRTIHAAYSHTDGWTQLDPLLEPIYLSPYTHTHLTAETGLLIEAIRDHIGITTPIVRASDLGPTRPAMADRITDLCHHAEADVLLNTVTAQQYLDETMLEGIHIEWFNYNHPIYKQGEHEWQPYLSILDCLAYTSNDALAVIRAI